MRAKRPTFGYVVESTFTSMPAASSCRTILNHPRALSRAWWCSLRHSTRLLLCQLDPEPCPARGTDWGYPSVDARLMSSQRRSAFFWFVLATCGVYAGFFVFAIYATVRYHGWVKDGGWDIRHDLAGRSYVSIVDERGAAAGRLEAGDRLIAINGDERRAVIGVYQ